MAGTVGKPIAPEAIELTQVCARIVSVAYDNGFTPGSSEGPTRPNFVSWNWNFPTSSLNLNCEDIDTGEIGTPGSPTPQLQTWADLINAVAPANYFAAFGFKPAPTWRYTKLTTCDPNAQFGAFTMTRDTFPDEPYKIYPVCKEVTNVIAWRYFTIAKDGTKTLHWCKPDPDNPNKFIESEAPMWEPVEGDGLVPIPTECFVNCDYQFGDCIKAVPEVACTSKILDGTFCDKVYASEPDELDQTVQEDIFIEFIQCEDGTTYTDYFTIVDNGPEPYTPQGEIVDCETCLPPVIAPECPEGAVFECVEVPGDFEFILDNSLWNDGVANPLNHLPKNADMVIAICDAAGNELGRSGPLAEPYYNALINNPFPSCSIVPVCANHTSASGCNINQVANLEAFGHYDPPTAPADVQNNLSNPAQSELWASGWGVRCTGCGEEPAQAKVVGANAANASFIGIAKNLKVYRGETQTLFRAITCSGIYWKDCEGNDVPAPASACCATPKGPTPKEDKQLSVETFRVCWFADGDITNCAEGNVTQTFATKETCVVDGKVTGVETSYTEIDGTTPFDPSTLGESAVAVPCRIDENGNVLICHEKCYEYTVPVIVKPVKSVKSIKLQATAIKKATLVKSKVVEETPIRALAVAAGEEPATLEYNPGDCLRVTECCLCGSTEIVETTYELQQPDLSWSEIDGPVEVGGETLWVEKPCDPRLDCPKETLVDLGDCTIAALTQSDCNWCCTFEVPSDRNGYNNPFQSTNFTIGSYTGATFDDVVAAMEADDYTVERGECLNAECHYVEIVVCGPEKVETFEYDNAQSGRISAPLIECKQVPCGFELLEEIRDAIRGCCEPRVVPDAICYPVEVTLGDLVVPAGQPILRQTTYATAYNEETCACEDLPGEGSVSYYEFTNPLNDVTEEVEALEAESTLCDPVEVRERKQCTPDGTVYYIADVEVGTIDGSVAATTVYNQNGMPVEVPENLGPCPGQLYPTCGCIRNADGSIAQTGVSLWQGTDENGSIIYGGIKTNDENQSEVTLKEGQTFDCDCSDKCADKVELTEYSYDVSDALPCATPSIVVDGETIELCDEDSTGGTVPTTGDICTTGGVRSVIGTGARCGRPAGTADPINAAGQLLNGGEYCPSTGGSTSQYTDTDIAVNGSFPISGAVPALTLGMDYSVLSGGISFFALDCATGNYLPPTAASAGNLQNYTPDQACQAQTPGGGAFGTKTLIGTSIEFDSSAVADVSTVVFGTIVQGPTDCFGNLTLNGEPFGPQSCSADTIEDLAQLLTGATGDTWTVADGVLTVKSGKEYGPISCGESSIAPTTKDCSVDIQADWVGIKPSQFDALLGKLCEISESLKSVNVIQKEVKGCLQFEGFDVDRGLVSPGDTTEYVTSAGTIVLDYLSTSDNTNVSSYYADLVAFVGVNTNFAMSVATDVSQNDQGKVLWQLNYCGPGNETLTIQKDNDLYTFNVDASGAITGTVVDTDTNEAFNSPAIVQACE